MFQCCSSWNKNVLYLLHSHERAARLWDYPYLKGNFSYFQLRGNFSAQYSLLAVDRMREHEIWVCCSFRLFFFLFVSLLLICFEITGCLTAFGRVLKSAPTLCTLPLPTLGDTCQTFSQEKREGKSEQAAQMMKTKPPLFFSLGWTSFHQCCWCNAFEQNYTTMQCILPFMWKQQNPFTQTPSKNETSLVSGFDNVAEE